MIKTWLVLIFLLSAGAGDGFRISHVPKTNHKYIEFKLMEDIQATDINAIQSFFMSKEGFYMCDVKEASDCIKVETAQRVTTENINQIMLHLGYHIDINWPTTPATNR